MASPRANAIISRGEQICKLYLTGTNTCVGGTIVSGDGELIVTDNEALSTVSSLTVGNESRDESELRLPVYQVAWRRND